MNYKICIVGIFITLYALLSHKTDDRVRCFEASNEFPKIDSSGKLIGYDTGVVRIYYYGKFRVYELPYIYRSFDKNGIFFSEVRKHLVAFNTDSIFGYDYDKKKNPVRQRVRIDSTLKYEWIIGNKIYPILTSNISLLTSKKENKTSGSLFVAYKILKKEDSSAMGLLKLWFKEKSGNIDVTLSRELDSVFKMRLYKSEIVSFPRYFKEYNYKMDGYKICNKLKEIPVTNKKEILHYFIGL